MKILILGGAFPPSRYDEILSKSKMDVQFAANNFQRLLFSSLKNIMSDDVRMLSAPFVNAYPKGYKDMIVPSWGDDNGESYVGFVNIWGYRNISRFHTLKKALSKFIDEEDKEKYIIVYSSHVPLIRAANYAKKKDHTIKTVLILPDLPQFMMLRNDASIIYQYFKSLDNRIFYKNVHNINAFIYFAEKMNDMVNNKNKPFIVVEGIADYKGDYSIKKNKEMPIRLAYTGTLHERYGIKKLIEAYALLPENTFCLDICGSGDSQKYVEDAAQKMQGITYYGQCSSNFSLDIQKRADILVNPRCNNEEYTKYSFPSKNLEYLSTGKPVICYKLDGIPSEYDQFFNYPNNNTIEALAEKIIEVSLTGNDQLYLYHKRLKEFFNGSKGCSAVANRILSFLSEV